MAVNSFICITITMNAPHGKGSQLYSANKREIGDYLRMSCRIRQDSPKSVRRDEFKERLFEAQRECERLLMDAMRSRLEAEDSNAEEE